MTERSTKTRKANSRHTVQRKPPHSYIALISTAILSSPRKKLTLTEINKYLVSNYEFFRGDYQGWKNSVRHNLSFNKCFVKILKDPSRPWGKDNYWTVLVDLLEEYIREDGCFRRRRRRKSREMENIPSRNGKEGQERQNTRYFDVKSNPDSLFTSHGVQNKGNIDLNRFSIDRLLQLEKGARNSERLENRMCAGFATGGARQGYNNQNITDYQYDAYDRRANPFLYQYQGQATHFGTSAWIHRASHYTEKPFVTCFPESQAVTSHYYI